MYRTVKKKLDKLPYGSLVTRLFRHLGIEIPLELKNEELPSLTVSEGIIYKMHLKPTMEGWKNAKDELVSVGKR